MAEAARIGACRTPRRWWSSATRSRSSRPRSRAGCHGVRSCSAAAAAPTSARSGASPARHERLAVVWLDAHGDLNTPETSPSGNLWGMPLRMAIDEGSVDAGGRRARRRPRPRPARGRVRRASTGSTTTSTRALDGVDAAYVALDVDVLEPGDRRRASCPSAGRARRWHEVEELLRDARVARTASPGSGSRGSPPGADPATLARARGRGRALTDGH